MAGALIGFNLARRGAGSLIVRLEKSVQIGRPVEEVFDAWSNFHRLPEYSNMIKEVRVFGNRSQWRVEANGTPFEWEAELTQLLPYQAIGWKSTGGVRHTGRITFSRISNDTLVHIHMNYIPPAGRLLRPVAASFSGEIEGYIEQALRDFKSSLEAGGPSVRRTSNPAAATGTYGPGPELANGSENTRFGAPQTPVEHTRPPEAKY